ncbi:uncharacterized protein FOMMEDRAFT_159378 [Fomitiporia mediterranea MF3/22]|uniref:uncharacterized protein n=1 Tax=Fomitiporia mediterranea (strain MF3/22) TaxID=694068 RepID=UPI0004409869|nr:uncharacterized protein FOMMEDRAFT_159378 [Fomitiporia mediterranea MF3/22]EJD00617.1 hypothetical protein FOMMEDRAFT_159378 [Fomitiporia mediterranea MF3/22]
MTNHSLDYGHAYSFFTSSIRATDAKSDDPNLVPLPGSESFTVQYVNAAMLTVVIYNALVTIDKEIKYIWVSSVLICMGQRFIDTDEGQAVQPY